MSAVEGLRCRCPAGRQGLMVLLLLPIAVGARTVYDNAKGSQPAIS
jgi:hypothetical protein